MKSLNRNVGKDAFDPAMFFLQFQILEDVQILTDL